MLRLCARLRRVPGPPCGQCGSSKRHRTCRSCRQGSTSLPWHENRGIPQGRRGQRGTLELGDSLTRGFFLGRIISPQSLAETESLSWDTSVFAPGSSRIAALIMLESASELAAEGANTATMPDAHFGIGCTAQSAPPSYQPPTRGRYLVSRCSSNPHRETSYNAASPFLAAQESPVQRNP